LGPGGHPLKIKGGPKRPPKKSIRVLFGIPGLAFNDFVNCPGALKKNIKNQHKMSDIISCKIM
jgi:hypothetical protein